MGKLRYADYSQKKEEIEAIWTENVRKIGN